MTKNLFGVEVADEEVVQAKVMRFIEREHGACTRSLVVRFEWTENGWIAKFYSSDRTWDARNNAKPMDHIPVNVADMAVAALKYLKILPIP
jgi:hypothetical protein